MLKFCSCRGCGSKRRRLLTKFYTRLAVRRLRHETKAALRDGREPAKTITAGR